MTPEANHEFHNAVRMLKIESTELGMRRLEQLSQQGDGHADAVMGAVYEFGQTPYKINLRMALHYYERAALRNGAVEALLGIGRITLAGPGEFRDYKRAFSSFSDAATAPPCPDARLALGEIYLNGLGKPVDLVKADSAFEAAANEGSFLGYTGRAKVAWLRGQYFKSICLRIRALRAALASVDAE